MNDFIIFLFVDSNIGKIHLFINTLVMIIYLLRLTYDVLISTFDFPFFRFFWLHTFHSNENGKKIYSSISNSIICFCDWDLFFQCWLNRKSWSWASFDHYHIEWPLANFIHSFIQKSILLLLIDLNQSIYAIFLATYLIKWMVNMSWF